MKQKSDSLQENQDLNQPAGSHKSGGNMFSVIQHYVDANGKKIIGISIAVIVVVALFFVIKGVVENKNEEERLQASLTLSRILPYYEALDCQKALNGDPQRTAGNQKVIGLVEIVNKYKGTIQGKEAALYAGKCFLTLNNIPKATEYFEIAIDSPSKIVMEGANAGLGVCYETKGNYKEAAEKYEKASTLSMTSGSKNRYQYYAGLCYEKIGDKEKAEKLYREIINENRSDFVGQAKAGLVRLGTVIE